MTWSDPLTKRFIHSILIACITMATCKNDRHNDTKLPLSKGEAIWLKTFEFDPGTFLNPPPEFGPFTRWWWPGNDVTKEELKREVELLAENGFAGVEVQPFTRGLNPDAPREELERVYSWDTPEFYENLKTVLDQARISGLIVDLNGGSGWPTGGPHIKQEDNILNLGYASLNIEGGKKISMEVPRPSMKHRPVAMAGIQIKYAEIDPALAKLQAVVAARIVLEQEGEPIHLDSSTVKDISGSVRENMINWDAPGGKWKIIAFWSYPAGEIPVLIAKKDPGLVVDHLDSAKVIANYEYLFGTRSGLEPYYGNPLRAIFNDSYEFKVDRHYSEDFLDLFRKRRGYDITPWLPANMQPGYNNHAESAYFPNQNPDFYFSPDDWRLRYDYDFTLSDVLQDHFFTPTRNWFESRGMLHRTQPYGLAMDIIAAAGNSSIPETEQLFSEGSEGFLKIVTSGAHLYNRPLITSESVVYRYRGEMTTPQKIKISVDKAFAAGINQIIYHGTSYKYNTPDFSEEGWNAWDSPFTPNITYSSNINESDNFWDDIKYINEYIKRIQYALRSGKPKTDVLIYFPFLGVESRELMSNPRELLPLGYFKGVEPESVIPAFGAPSRKPAESTRWYHMLWPFVNELEESGITWEFTNDVSIQAAKMQDGMIDIRGNRYHSLLLVHVPHIQKESAMAINKLSKKGAKVMFAGEIPAIQAGFLNFKDNDTETFRLLNEIVKEDKNRILDEKDLSVLTGDLNLKIKPADKYPFIRQLKREMKDGSLLYFIWNISGSWQPISVETDAVFQNNYWLDGEKGSIISSKGRSSSYTLAPYGTIIFYASKDKVEDKLLSEAPVTSYGGKELMTIDRWNVVAGKASVKNSALFDWRSDKNFKYQSSEGIYSTSFTLEKVNDQSRYYLDMGKVFFTADVTINGQSAGKRIYAPYELDITPYIKQGINRISIKITPVQRNHSIGEAMKGNPKYAQFRNLENTLMPAGLVGPVVIKVGLE